MPRREGEGPQNSNIAAGAPAGDLQGQPIPPSQRPAAPPAGPRSALHHGHGRGRGYDDVHAGGGGGGGGRGHGKHAEGGGCETCEK